MDTRGVSRRRSSTVNRKDKDNDNDIEISAVRQYSTRQSSSQIRTNDLPLELDANGFKSPWAFFWIVLSGVVPFAYIYILLMILRDLCIYFPDAIYHPLQHYVPFLARLADRMNNSSKVTEVWCVIEALFFIGIKLKIHYLQTRDPLEASLSAAPMMDPKDRKILWDRMIEIEKDDPGSFLEGWFFDQPIENISRYDVCDFLCWSMFDGRNQEHLTLEELTNLEDFVEDLEHYISLKRFGPKGGTDDQHEQHDQHDENIVREEIDPLCHSEQPDLDKEKENAVSSSISDDTSNRYTPSKANDMLRRDHRTDSLDISGCSSQTLRHPLPKEMFRFSVETQSEEPSFFSDLYESYRQRYEHYKNMIENADFHPVQDFRNILAETAQKIEKAEESALATASQMYETIVKPGSSMDKQLSAVGQKAHEQLADAWNSVKGMKERFETAQFLSAQRTALVEQMRGNRAMLTRMREMSYAVPSKQMAALMRKITECNKALERTEGRAKEAFVHATGLLAESGKHLSIFQPRKEPQRYAKYSYDPLLGISTFPLGFHLLVLGCTEIPLRVMLKNRGFERRYVGPVTYYYHPGSDEERDFRSFQETRKTPIIFVHGIGVGNIFYMPLIDHFLKTGRPLLLPEIPYVSGFRPWQSSSAVLSPAVVASTMTAMLATHGFARGTFVGHSYGTSWLSYVCKYAPTAVAALLFLDPVCFCLHFPRLTKNFVYHRPDPGTSSFMIRTDVIVNWTIQRSFPWAWITLFTEQVHVPCTVFLSEEDALVPAVKVEQYFRSKNIPICDHESLPKGFFDTNGDFTACVFRGDYHGGWSEQPAEKVPAIAEACNALCRKVEAKDN